MENYFDLHGIRSSTSLIRHYEKHPKNIGANYFFSPGSKRFFNSRILDSVYPTKKLVYFVTSEKFDYKSPRLFTIRAYNPKTGSIDTIGEFQQYKTSLQAKKAILKLL